MTVTLWLSAWLMGLVGGPHCLAMCGGACAALTGRCGGAGPQRALLAWQAGRLVAYAGAGAAVASSVSLLGQWGRQLAWLQPWWLMLHLAALALGLWMLSQGRAPAWLGGARSAPLPAVPGIGRTATRPATAPVLAWAVVDGPRPTPAAVARAPVLQAAVAGLAWIALPCGLLHAALLTAALGSTALDGAVAMTAFAIGSGISLWFGPRLWLSLTHRLGGSTNGGPWRLLSAFGPAQATRLAGALLASGSAWAVWHAVLGPAVDAWCA